MIEPNSARPRVTIHYAQTLDGRIATCTGDSQWIGGEASRGLAHQLRASHEAVLVGVGTVLADNPRLTVRLVPGRSPLRLVADSTLRTPLDAHVLSDGAAETLIATTARASAERIATLRERGTRVLVVNQDADVALEASGNGESLGQALESVAFQGTAVVCSWYGTKPANLMLGGAFHRGRLRLVSSQVGALDPALQPRWDRARRTALALDLLPQLQLSPLISHRLPFRRAAEAYHLVDRHPEEVVQVLLTYEVGDGEAEVGDEL